MSEPNEQATSLEKKAVRTSPVLWVLGGLLALLLAALGTHALYDLGDLFPEPYLDTGREPGRAALDAESEALDVREREHSVQLERARTDLEVLERTLATAEESWRNWLATRATLGQSTSEDAEVRARRDRLDKLRGERDAAAERIASLRAMPQELVDARAALEARLREVELAAQEQFSAAHRAWELRVLGARLALLIPVVLLAGFLWRRRQKSRYITLLWGYWAFAVWLLGVGIYPYLPHYGGYLPLIGGVALTWWLAVSLVRYFNNRAAARRRRIVDLAIAGHRCPGCDRDYLIGRETGLSLAIARKATSRAYDTASLRPRACSGCGLPLFGECATCQAVQVVHLDHCAACGAAWVTAKTR